MRTTNVYFQLKQEINGGNINLVKGLVETLLCSLNMGADGGIGTI